VLEDRAETEKLVKTLKKEIKAQLEENDNTVKRYRKQLEEGKEFAISKFAKDLLEVRDTLKLAQDHVNMDKINSIEDLEQLQKEYENIVKGQEMVTNLFDTVLKRFNVV
jgi:molecular chaperone GrpE (heat shock protein)